MSIYFIIKKGTNFSTELILQTSSIAEWHTNVNLQDSKRPVTIGIYLHLYMVYLTTFSINWDYTEPNGEVKSKQ